MLQYVFDKPIPVAELDAELRFFARLVADEGYDTISRMVVVLQPTLRGEPFELRRGRSDVPITRVTFESRLASSKPGKSLQKPSRGRDRADGDD
ncbi:hypothetical protein [Sphingopyxis sp.]|uniref:hypothetical protein n=1 Tax=Sphingopyxis sp. TaxID=1908224 RepID=UPI0025D2156B|nr:hypothetical protein [Sphingopyxis sp.]MBR2174653.1 hypothetical protein [Sphingopyxis sp.]